MMRTYAEAAFEATVIRKKHAPIGSRWRHVNGARYEIKDVVLIEGTMTPAITYRATDCQESVTWCRPAAEFLDGRFEREPR